MSSPTGGPKGLSQWSTKITVEFIQLPDDKRAQYDAALAWFAEQIKKEMTAPKAVETVNG